MSKVFKRSTKAGAPWYVTYYEILPNGRKRRRIRSTGTSEHAIAKQIAAKYASEAAVRAHGVVDLRQEQLAKFAKLTIAELRTGFENKMRKKAKSDDKNAKQTLGYLTKFQEFAGIKTIGEIDADDANEFKVHLFDLDRSARTVQANVNALKHFSNWLFETGKLITDPLLSVKAPNPKDDRRKERRMLLPTEWDWLVRGIAARGEQRGMTAEARTLLYRLAIQTGLRSAELRSLTRGNFHFGQAGASYVKVSSNNTKNSQAAHQNIDAGLAANLQAYLSRKTPQAAAFDLPSPSRVVDMIRDDMKAARACWLGATKEPQERAEREQSDFLCDVNEAGESFDFHALRHTCGAWLAIRGVQPKVIQSVMRHSTITLTMDRYVHLIEGAEAAAVASSADLTAMPAMATGTDGPEARFPIVSNEDACTVRSGARGCELAEDKPSDEETKKPHFPLENAAYCEPVRVTCEERRARESNPQLLPATDFESAS